VDICATLIAPDDCAQLSQTLRHLAPEVDLIVTTGGVSVGEEDHVHHAVRNAGGKIVVAGAAIKPGKPITVGHIGKTMLIGLPGNPVSAFVTWTVFGRPILDKLAGMTPPRAQRRHVVTGHALHHRPGRCELRPANITGHDPHGHEIVSAGEATHSARLAPLLAADGLLVIPAEATQIAKGEILEFLPL
jgi:molybdopterin molybdotransferase